MKLYYTPKSHYARKDRILCEALKITPELIDAGNVADHSLDIFANNPMMKVPTLIDGDQVVFESDHIAQYIACKYDPQDQYQVLTTDVEQLNARSVMNGVMTAEVDIIMAERTGIDTHNYSRFEKLREVVNNGLNWLECNDQLFKNQPNYNGFHLVCLWDHLVLYDMFNLSHPKTQQCVENLSKHPFVANSSPLM